MFCLLVLIREKEKFFHRQKTFLINKWIFKLEGSSREISNTYILEIDSMAFEKYG